MENHSLQRPRRGETFVAMYHYVRPAEPGGLNYLPLDVFRWQLDWLAEHYGILNREDWAALKSGELRPGVLLTFDDGLSDGVRWVLPELVSRGIEAIFYVCSDVFTNQKVLSVHLVHFLLRHSEPAKALEMISAELSQPDLRVIEDEIGRVAYSRHRDSASKKLLKRLVNYGMSSDRYRPALLEAISVATGIQEADLARDWYLNQDELREILKHGQVIGSHTCSHRLLSRLEQDEVRIEVCKSRATIEEILGITVDDFCYPYGGPTSYNPMVINELRRAGYRTGMSVESRPVSSLDTENLFEIPRFDCNYFLPKELNS